MRILLCSWPPLDPRLGTAQTLLALGGALEQRGHVVTYVDPARLDTDPEGFSEALGRYLTRHAGAFDVVDYDYRHVAFRREALPRHVLFVARVQLLEAQLVGVEVPPLPRLRSRVGHMLKRRRRAAALAAAASEEDRMLAGSDLVVTLNTRDRDCLVGRGHAPARVVVIPNGLGTDTADRLVAVSAAVPPGPPCVAFVGMYGPRKGGGDFPRFFCRLAEASPGVRLRLLGTQGMLKTAEEVRALFPRRLRGRVEVVPRYWPEELAGLLSPCWAGVFPSYNEGFGLGILEMLAAALPVVAYDAPGVGPEIEAVRLVPRGDVDALAGAVAALLNDPGRLAEARLAARAAVLPYRWAEVARQTEAAYEAALARRRAAIVA